MVAPVHPLRDPALEHEAPLDAFRPAVLGGVVVDHDRGEGREADPAGVLDGLPIRALVEFSVADEAEDAPARQRGADRDAELEEGSNWEAVQYAGRIELASLTAIVIDNDSSSHGWPDGVERRFMLEGWVAQRVDGRDHEQLEAALEPAPEGTRPRVVVAEVETR